MRDKPLFFGVTARHLTSAVAVFTTVAFGTPAAYDAYLYRGSDAYRKIIDNSKAINTHWEVVQDETTKPVIREMLEHMIAQREQSSSMTCRFEAQSWLACTMHRVYLEVMDVR